MHRAIPYLILVYFAYGCTSLPGDTRAPARVWHAGGDSSKVIIGTAVADHYKPQVCPDSLELYSFRFMRPDADESEKIISSYAFRQLGIEGEFAVEPALEPEYIVSANLNYDSPAGELNRRLINYRIGFDFCLREDEVYLARIVLQRRAGEETDLGLVPPVVKPETRLGLEEEEKSGVSAELIVLQPNLQEDLDLYSRAVYSMKYQGFNHVFYSSYQNVTSIRLRQVTTNIAGVIKSYLILYPFEPGGDPDRIIASMPGAKTPLSIGWLEFGSPFDQ